jgi:hypothetical protein
VCLPSRNFTVLFFLQPRRGLIVFISCGRGNPCTTHLFFINGKDDVFTDTRDRYHVTLSYWIGIIMPLHLEILIYWSYLHDGRFKTLGRSY